jgi:hypothetical protein
MESSNNMRVLLYYVWCPKQRNPRTITSLCIQHILYARTHICIHYVIFINYFSISSKPKATRTRTTIYKYYITRDVRFNSHTTGRRRILPAICSRVVDADRGNFIRCSHYTRPPPPNYRDPTIVLG